MKIKILHLTYDMGVGGTEQVIRQLIENTPKDTFETSIGCIENNLGEMGILLKEKGVNVKCFNRKPGFDLKLIISIRRYITQENIDILHCHQYTPYIYGVISAMFTDKSVIFTEHGRFYPDRSSWKRRVINPLLSFFTDAITTISKATKKALITYENIPASKIKVVYNGIRDRGDEEFRNKDIKSKLGINQGDIVIGTVSRLDPVKNHKLILDAFKCILSENKSFKLLVIGDGELRKELENKALNLNINSNTIFTGFIPDPIPYISIMDIFLLPSFTEGTSMTLLEAMSLSKPCVVTNVGGNPEIVIDKETGEVIQNNDLQGLVSAIKNIANNEDKRTRYSTNARERFVQNFSIANMINNYRNIYNKIMK